MAKKTSISKKKKQPKKGFFVSLSKKIHQLIFLFAVVVAIPVTMLFAGNHSSNQNTPAHAASSVPIYGIAAGSVMPGLSSADLNSYLDDYKNLGAKWIRFDFSWSDIQPNNTPTYSWSSYDTVVQAANARGINVLGIIDSTPQWAVDPACTNSSYWQCAPGNSTQFATFSSALVTHYAPMGVHYWEIWNEPNGGAFTPSTYTALLKAAYPVIKQVDPNSFVLAGGSMPAPTSGSQYSPVAFLDGMYQNGAKGYFDAVTHHPYCYDAINAGYGCPLTSPQNWSAWSQMQDTNPSLRSIMTANGDGSKQIWATEFGAPTGGDATRDVTEMQQAQMVSDAYKLWTSYSWSGPMFWYTYHDPCTTTTDVECFFGLVRYDLSHKPAYAMYQSLATAASTTVTPTSTVTNMPTPTVTPTPVPASVSVTSLSATGTTTGNPTTFTYTLNTVGNLTVDNMIVAIRDASNGGHDTAALTNIALSGTQNFTQSQTLTAGTYTYWVAYQKGGVWTDLSPKQVITITNPSVSISNLSVKDSSHASSWSVQSNIQTGNKLYGDRSYTIVGLPSSLAGAPWIRTANASKTYTKSPVVTFTINTQASVYIALDARAKKPSWLDSTWTNTGLQVKDSEPVTFTFYKKVFPAGMVSLGQNSANNASGVDMYSIIVQ